MPVRLALAALLLLAAAIAQKPNTAVRPRPAPPKPAVAKPIPKLPATVDAILSTLTLRDRVAQLVMATCYGEGISVNSATYRKYRHWVEDLHVGGFIVAN